MPPETNEATWQPRTFGRDLLQTRRDTVPLEDIVPNPNQPRQGPKKDPQLKKEIIENGGIFEPLLVEPHPEGDGKFRIIDGERRHANSLDIVEDLRAQKADDTEIDRFYRVPIETTNRTLSDEERFRVWVYIHRQRKDWTRREKEEVAYSLVKYMDRARAAAVLGISVRELDKTVAIYETSVKLTGLRDPDAAITWAREINNVSPRYRTPEVEVALIRKINEGKLINSKEVREIRRIVPNSDALAEFMTKDGTIGSALSKLPAPTPSPGNGTRPGYGVTMAADLQAFSQQLGRYSWEELELLKGDEDALGAIAEAEAKLSRLKAALGSPQTKRKAT